MGPFLSFVEGANFLGRGVEMIPCPPKGLSLTVSSNEFNGVGPHRFRVFAMRRGGVDIAAPLGFKRMSRFELLLHFHIAVRFQRL